jgi:hypothetical protein
MAEQPKNWIFGNMEAHEHQRRTGPRYIEPLSASENHALGYEKAFFIAQRSSIVAAITRSLSSRWEDRQVGGRDSKATVIKIPQLVRSRSKTLSWVPAIQVPATALLDTRRF